MENYSRYPVVLQRIAKEYYLLFSFYYWTIFIYPNRIIQRGTAKPGQTDKRYIHSIQKNVTKQISDPSNAQNKKIKRNIVTTDQKEGRNS